MTAWRHVMTSRHDDMTFCNMSVKCSNDLLVWWNPWFTFGLIFLCSIEPEIALHVIMTSWRHVVTSSFYGNVLYEVPYKLTCVVGPLNQSWYCVSMLNDTGYKLACQDVVIMTSWHDGMVSWVDGNIIWSSSMTYLCWWTSKSNHRSRFNSQYQQKQYFETWY